MQSAAAQRFKKLKPFQLTEAHRIALASCLRKKPHCTEQDIEAIWKKLNEESAAISDYPSKNILFPREQKAEDITERKENHQEIRLPSLFPTSTQQGIDLFYRQEQNKGRHCAATIFANSIHMPWPTDAPLQEESVLLCSTARVYGPQGSTSSAYFLQNEKPTDVPGKNGLDLLGHGYCVKQATLFHDGETMLPTWRLFSPIFIAAADLRTVDFDFKESLYLGYVEYMKRLIRAQYDLALQAGADTLIAGALGCGAFKNNPYLIAYLQILILQEPQYKKLNVQFHVLNKSGLDKNYQAFDTVLTRYAELEKQFGDLSHLSSNSDFKNFIIALIGSPDSLNTRAENPPNDKSTGKSAVLIDKLQDLFKDHINELAIGDPLNSQNLMNFTLPISDEKRKEINELGSYPGLFILNRSSHADMNIRITEEACNGNIIATLLTKVECANERSARILKYFVHRARDTREYFHFYSRFFGGVSRSQRLQTALKEFIKANALTSSETSKKIRLESIETGYQHWSNVLRENKKTKPIKKQASGPAKH